jgi:hypothetical protein
MTIPSTYRRAAAAGAVAVLGLLSVGIASTAQAALPTAVVFDASVGTPLPGNVPSQPFQAQQTAEFGDAVHLSGSNRVLQSATVTMSDWALASDYPDLGTSWTHPITFNVYTLNASGTEPGTLLGTVTQDFEIPWRPVADPTHCPAIPTQWYSTADAKCYNGFAFNITFDLSGITVPVPNDIVYGIAYNTNTWGTPPIGQPGPYESLNVGLNSSATATAGDIDTGSVFWNTMTASNYSDGGAGGTGTFRRDTGWLPYRPAVTLTASAVSCLFSTSGTTMTLQNDCTTDQTILIPDAMTLNGNGHSITAVDPTGGHFVGAVVANGYASASVTNLTVTTSHLSDVCDAGPDRLRGIMLDGASGSITHNTVVGINQGLSGCQEGNAIDVRNTPFDGSHPGTKSVTISGNTIRDYQKTGILASGDVLATITNNTVTGSGPINYIAQNGIQVSFGASATVKSNTVSGNWYVPASYVACGVLLYNASGVKASSNTLFANERDNCNFGKGGGNVAIATP